MARKRRKAKAALTPAITPTTTTDDVSSTSEAVASSSQSTRNDKSSSIITNTNTTNTNNTNTNTNTNTNAVAEDDQDDTIVVTTNTPTTTWLDDVLPPTPGMEDLSTMRVALVGASLLTVGTVGFYHIPGLIRKHDIDHDHHDHPSANNRWIDAFYCATMTLTTYVRDTHDLDVASSLCFYCVCVCVCVLMRAMVVPSLSRLTTYVTKGCILFSFSFWISVCVDSLPSLIDPFFL